MTNHLEEAKNTMDSVAKLFEVKEEWQNLGPSMVQEAIAHALIALVEQLEKEEK